MDTSKETKAGMDEFRDWVASRKAAAATIDSKSANCGGRTPKSSIRMASLRLKAHSLRRSIRSVGCSLRARQIVMDPSANTTFHQSSGRQCGPASTAGTPTSLTFCRAFLLQ
jgi:hypothetical protein